MLVDQLHQGGGTETHTFTLAKRLIRQGYQVGVFTAGGSWIHHFRNYGIPVHIGHSTDFLQAIVNYYSYNLLHSHCPWGNLLLSNFKSRTNIPSVITLHALYYEPATLLRAASTVDAVIAVSEGVKNYATKICGVTQIPVHVITNGVSSHEFRPQSQSNLRRDHGISRDDFVIGYTGRFTFDKIELGMRICKIAQSYARRHRRIRILVAGRGSSTYCSTNSKLVKMEFVPDMHRYLNSCDLVITTGRTAVESLFCGVPTIAVGTRQYIGLVTRKNLSIATATNFGDQAVVPIPWNNRRLMRDIRFVYHHIEQSKKFTKAVRRHIRRDYSLTKVVQKITSVYDSISMW